MFTHLFIGGLLIGLTVIFQAFAFDFILRRTTWLRNATLGNFRSVSKALILAIIVLGVACTLVVEIWFWALFYYFTGALSDLETAVYFSTTSFTTLGFGDVVLDENWRMLGGIEATNGFLLFGGSTAFILEFVSRIYRKEGEAIERRTTQV